MIKLFCDKQSLKRVDSHAVVAGGYGFITFSYDCDESWEGYSVTAQFHRLGDDTAYHVASIQKNRTYTVPCEVIGSGGVFTVCLFGVKGEYARVTTNVVTVEVRENGLLDHALPQPTPDIFNQYVKSVLQAAETAAQAAVAAQAALESAEESEAFIRSVFVEDEFAAQVADWNASFATDVKNAKAALESQKNAALSSVTEAGEGLLRDMREAQSEGMDAYTKNHEASMLDYRALADAKRSALQASYAHLVIAADHVDQYDGRIRAIEENNVGRVSSDNGTAKGEIFNDYENNTAYGDYSHAEGVESTAEGRASHAEGFGCRTTSNYGHAEGYQSLTGYISHAEGNKTEAMGDKAHAEGSLTKASGKESHAEGYYTEASGQRSHAEGAITKAMGHASHAEGIGTTAVGEAQHVGGKYNVGKEGTLFEIGNGTAHDATSNAFEVYEDGHAELLTQGSGDNAVVLKKTLLQADWSQSDRAALDFIKNKPSIPTVPKTFHVMSVGGWGDDKTLPDPLEWFAAHPANGARYDGMTKPALSEPILWLDENGGWTFYIVQYDYAEIDVDNVLESAEWAELEFAKVSDIPKVDSQYGLSMDYNKNIRVSPATNAVILAATEKYKPVTPYYLGYGVGCHGIARLSTMPSAESKYLGWVVLYRGESNEQYTQNTLYECVNDGGYKWIKLTLSA